ncbi:MAG TPA: cell division protein ZipA, partial [Psychromonas sp.]
LLEKQTAIDSSYQKENNHLIDDLEFSHPRGEYEQDNIDFSEALDEQDFETINFSEQNDSNDSDVDAFSQQFSFDAERVDNPENVATLGPGSETGPADMRESIAESQKRAISEPVKAAPEDVFVFNVVAREGSRIRGSEILQFFLTSGFRFGENAFFHRHLNSDGTGPVLFSIANMMAPGVFDPDNMEQFFSEGISFFVVAPNPDINIKEAFDMMLTAVQQMTDEFECVVLNEHREPFTEQQFRDDHERLMRYV